jgi:membrane fusion protein (multidrug efflux system)
MTQDTIQDAMEGSNRGKLARPTRKRRPALIGLIVVLAVAAVSGAGYWWWHSRSFETTDDAFIASHVTAVSPQVGGRVLEVLVKDNQNVKVGDVLIKLDQAPFQVKVDQAQANLNEVEQKLQEARSQHQVALATADQIRADLASAESQAANADMDYKRYKNLVDSGAVSQQAHDNAETQARTSVSALLAAHKRLNAAVAQAELAGTQILTAQAEVEKNRAALNQTLLDLSYTEIKSQVNGSVTKKAVEPGDYVQTGQNVLELVQDDVWVVANFKETQLTDMRPGQPVSMTVDAYPDQEFRGHVESIQAGTGAAFSLLPAENASGNYVKVVQRVPVKIVFDLITGQAWHLETGMSVVPQVKVR